MEANTLVTSSKLNNMQHSLSFQMKCLICSGSTSTGGFSHCLQILYLHNGYLLVILIYERNKHRLSNEVVRGVGWGGGNRRLGNRNNNSPSGQMSCTFPNLTQEVLKDTSNINSCLDVYFLSTHLFCQHFG